jgi:hypothetical protein
VAVLGLMHASADAFCTVHSTVLDVPSRGTSMCILAVQAASVLTGLGLAFDAVRVGKTTSYARVDAASVLLSHHG